MMQKIEVVTCFKCTNMNSCAVFQIRRLLNHEVVSVALGQDLHMRDGKLLLVVITNQIPPSLQTMPLRY